MSRLALPALALVAGCSMLPGAFTRTPVPAELAPGADRRLEMVVAARGVQIYRCDPKPDQPGRFEWALQAPEAVLRDVAGKYLGKHYAGPTWEAEDGSKIVGTAEARRDAPVRTAIPWLRLSTRSTGTPGLFAGVKTVLRIGTGGGVPPDACTELERGTILRVPYTADYNFYVMR